MPGRPQAELVLIWFMLLSILVLWLDRLGDFCGGRLRLLSFLNTPGLFLALATPC